MKIDECFELDFDKVDPSQQDGLTHRMLVILKSLGETVSFWQADGEQTSEEAFRLVGLEEEDMYALGRVIRKADKLLDERRFREAYDKLSEARRWFDPETLQEERAKVHERAERASERKSQKHHGPLETKGDAGGDKFKQMTNSKDKKGADEDFEGWEQVGRKKVSKVGEKTEPACKSRNNDSTQKKQRSFGKAEEKTEVASKFTKAPAQKSRQGYVSNARSAPVGRNTPQKFLCRYIVGIDQERSFNVVRKLLGDHGANMKAIAENSDAKLRIRGRGSGFKEGPNNVEADEPLMLCISATSHKGFENATEDVESLLKHVHEQYYAFCQHRNLPTPKLVVSRTEQPSR